MQIEYIFISKLNRTINTFMTQVKNSLKKLSINLMNRFREVWH